MDTLLNHLGEASLVHAALSTCLCLIWNVGIPWKQYFFSIAITLANNYVISRMTFFWKVLPGLRLPFSTMQGGCYDLYSGYYPLLKQFHVYLPSKCLTLTILIVITRAYCQETCKTHTTLFI